MNTSLTNTQPFKSIKGLLGQDIGTQIYLSDFTESSFHIVAYHSKKTEVMVSSNPIL